MPALLNVGYAVESQTEKHMFMLLAESLIIGAQNRFEERSYSPKGFIKIYLTKTFIYGTPEVIVYRGQVLIACYCAGHKVAYFLVSYHGDKWVIRTFLFLTNEVTPEGTELKEIIGSEKEDAKYLMIDRVTAFLDYDIEHDQRLRELFETTGCGSLLNYIKLFVRPEDNVKNSASIANYLFGKVDNFELHPPTRIFSELESG